VPRLAGRRLLVTGASSGIGAALVRELLHAGANVVATVRRREFEAELIAQGAIVTSLDVRIPDDVERAVTYATERLNGLDGVINNAGVMRLGSIEGSDHEDWKEMFETNVLGLLSVTKAALPYLRAEDRADVINIGSLSGRRIPSADAVVYAASKHAVHALTDGLRLQLRGTKVRVTQIAPGITTSRLGDGIASEDARRAFYKRQRDYGLDASVVARAAVVVLEQPPGATTAEILLVPTGQWG
jgi:NADP-dependent 3-hydroxy acid dehydrogenase YdfG